MARINRSDVIQKAVNDLAISGNTDKIPNETLDKVQLTYDLNRKTSSFIITGGQSTTGSIIAAFPTVSIGAETFITSVHLSYNKDATCDIATGTLNLAITPELTGLSTALVRCSIITLTADKDNIVLTFPYPLKVKNGSTITYAGTFSLGVLRRDYEIIGYTTSSN